MVWWTSSAQEWDKMLPQLAVGCIHHAVNSVSPVHHRILINLEASWHELNIPHLITCGVPIAYKRNRMLESDKIFYSSHHASSLPVFH